VGFSYILIIIGFNIRPVVSCGALLCERELGWRILFIAALHPSIYNYMFANIGDQSASSRISNNLLM
jgi:hypothetical protein